MTCLYLFFLECWAPTKSGLFVWSRWGVLRMTFMLFEFISIHGSIARTLSDFTIPQTRKLPIAAKLSDLAWQQRSSYAKEELSAWIRFGQVLRHCCLLWHVVCIFYYALSKQSVWRQTGLHKISRLQKSKMCRRQLLYSPSSHCAMMHL